MISKKLQLPGAQTIGHVPRSGLSTYQVREYKELTQSFLPQKPSTRGPAIGLKRSQNIVSSRRGIEGFVRKN